MAMTPRDMSLFQKNFAAEVRRQLRAILATDSDDIVCVPTSKGVELKLRRNCCDEIENALPNKCETEIKVCLNDDYSGGACSTSSTDFLRVGAPASGRTDGKIVALLDYPETWTSPVGFKWDVSGPSSDLRLPFKTEEEATFRVYPYTAPGIYTIKYERDFGSDFGKCEGEVKIEVFTDKCRHVYTVEWDCVAEEFGEVGVVHECVDGDECLDDDNDEWVKISENSTGCTYQRVLCGINCVGGTDCSDDAPEPGLPDLTDEDLECACSARCKHTFDVVYTCPDENGEGGGFGEVTHSVECVEDCIDSETDGWQKVDEEEGVSCSYQRVMCGGNCVGEEDCDTSPEPGLPSGEDCLCNVATWCKVVVEYEATDVECGDCRFSSGDPGTYTWDKFSEQSECVEEQADVAGWYDDGVLVENPAEHTATSGRATWIAYYGKANCGELGCDVADYAGDIPADPPWGAAAGEKTSFSLFATTDVWGTNGIYEAYERFGTIYLGASWVSQDFWWRPGSPEAIDCNFPEKGEYQGRISTLFSLEYNCSTNKWFVDGDTEIDWGCGGGYYELCDRPSGGWRLKSFDIRRL